MTEFHFSSVTRHSAGFPYSGIFFALAAMTRPEGLFVFAITVAHQAAWRILTERRLFTARDVLRGIRVRRDLCAVLAGTLVVLQIVSAEFVPRQSLRVGTRRADRTRLETPCAVRRRASGLADRAAADCVHGIASGCIGDCGSSQSVIAGSRSTDRGLSGQPTLPRIIIPYAAYIVYVGGDWSVGRFFVPLLPFFYLLFSTGLVDLWKTLVETRLRDWGKRGNSLAQL